MPSQLPEHVVVALLRQCFITPRCQASRIRQRTLWRSSTRALSTIRSSPSPRQRQALCAETQQRRSFITKSEADKVQPSGGVDSHSPAEINDYQPPLLLAEQHEVGRGQRQPQTGTRIAVLGGGITGLSTAYYLTKELPNAKITVYEGSERVGGWLSSKYVDVGNGKILFEQGPRTLRPHGPAALVTLEVIRDLRIDDQILITPKTSDAALNRFIYYPNHLVKMPGPGQDLFSVAWNLITEPIFKGVFTGALFEPSRDARPSDLEDESVASFLNRRLGGPQPGDNIVSAVLHGIYAGDIYQLSAKSIMAKAWEWERWQGSFGQAMVARARDRTDVIQRRDLVLGNDVGPKLQHFLTGPMHYAAVYTFKEGINTLALALERSLRANYNVQFHVNEKVTSVEYDDETDGIKIKTARNQPPAIYTKAISAISGRVLSTLTPEPIYSLALTHAVTVMVVNLYFKDPSILPERGFGYLIPRSISFDQNPECALGVVFDSDAVTGQDTVSGTKVTVMLGGHWWDGFDSYPDEAEGAAMAKAVLKRHLKIDEEPVAVNVGLQKECIPQYTVGHEARMRQAHGELMQMFKGKLAVAGNSYTGVGLNNCVRAARDVVMDIKDGQATGLESFVGGNPWVTKRLPGKAEVEEIIRRHRNPPS